MRRNSFYKTQRYNRDDLGIQIAQGAQMEASRPQESEAQARSALLDLINGFRITYAVQTAVQLGIAD